MIKRLKEVLELSLLKRTDVTRASISPRRQFLKRLATTLSVFASTSVLTPLQAIASIGKNEFLQKFRDELEGTLIAVNDEKYEIHRMALVWQMLKPKRFPALIVNAASIEDVIRTVNFARESNYKIAVRCGGHNYVSSYLADGTLALNVSRLQGLEVDRASRTAKVGPGVLGKMLTEELAKHGFAFPIAHPGRIALGGYLLGGGQGWNSQAWGGAACLSIEEVEVITADGQLVTANQKQNTDLYWAARGAGPCFFGVVISFTLKLYDNPKSVLRSTYVWPIEAAAEVSEWAYKKATEIPDFVETWFFMVAVPANDTDSVQSGSTDKICIMQSTAFASDEASARAALASLANAEQELKTQCLEKHQFEKTSITALLDETDAESLPWRYAADNMWSDEPPQTLTAKLIDHMADMPSDKSSIIFVFKPHDGPTPVMICRC